MYVTVAVLERFPFGFDTRAMRTISRRVPSLEAIPAVFEVADDIVWRHRNERMIPRHQQRVEVPVRRTPS